MNKTYVDVCGNTSGLEAHAVVANLHVSGISNVVEECTNDSYKVKVYESTGFKMEYLLEKILSLGYKNAKLVEE